MRQVATATAHPRDSEDVITNHRVLFVFSHVRPASRFGPCFQLNGAICSSCDAEHRSSWS